MLPKRNQGQAHCLGHLWHLCDSNALGAQAWALCLAGHWCSPLPIALFVCFSSPQFFAPLRSPSPKPQGPAGSLRAQESGLQTAISFQQPSRFSAKLIPIGWDWCLASGGTPRHAGMKALSGQRKKPGKQPGNDKLVPKKNSFGVENAMPFFC